MNWCMVCCKETENRCQRCDTPYCSESCQAEDWPGHKIICIPMPALVSLTDPEDEASEKQDTNVPEERLERLRPPNTKLPLKAVPLPDPNATQQTKSLFDNPFIRNTVNMTFKSNITMMAPLMDPRTNRIEQ